MARTFRGSDKFADKRGVFAARKAQRDARYSEFASLGYDDPDAFADLPMHGDKRRERTRAAFRHG